AYLRTRHPPNVPGLEFVAVAALCRWPANSDFSPNPSSSQEVLISWACIAPYDPSGNPSARKLPAKLHGSQPPYGFSFRPWPLASAETRRSLRLFADAAATTKGPVPYETAKAPRICFLPVREFGARQIV